MNGVNRVRCEDEIRTKEVIKRVHAESAIAEDALAVTAEGMKLQRSNARVRPSKIERGSSISRKGAGIEGTMSTRA